MKEILLAEKNAVEPHISCLLRYQEPLWLNRKGHQPQFKSITREKRNHLADGKNGTLDKTPVCTKYRPNYNVLMKEPHNMTLGRKDVEQHNFQEILDQKDKDRAKSGNDQIVC